MRNITKQAILNDSQWQLPDFTTVEFHPKTTKYCIIIPILNENGRIKTQLEKMQPYMDLADVIIADGGSSDGSVDHKYLKSRKVRTLLTKTSPGKQGTQLRMAFSFAMKQGYSGIVTIDGNNKDGVESIPKFIKKLDEGYDNVQGSRFIKGGKAINTPWERTLGIRLLASPIISLAAGHWFTDITNGFRGYSRKYILHPNLQPFRDIFIRYEFYFYLTTRASQLGLKTIEIPVTRSYPKGAVPTKIHGFAGNWNMLMTVFKVLFRVYHPQKSNLKITESLKFIPNVLRNIINLEKVK